MTSARKTKEIEIEVGLIQGSALCQLANSAVIRLSRINVRQKRGASKDVDNRVAEAWSKWRES